MVPTGGVEGVGVGAVVATGGVAGAGDGATTEAGTLSCVWDCFGASTLTGLVAGTALLEQPLMASNSARDIPATFIFHEDFKKIHSFSLISQIKFNIVRAVSC